MYNQPPVCSVWSDDADCPLLSKVNGTKKEGNDKGVDMMKWKGMVENPSESEMNHGRNIPIDEDCSILSANTGKGKEGNNKGLDMMKGNGKDENTFESEMNKDRHIPIPSMALRRASEQSEWLQ